ncbi:hypothetical protein [Prochlorococcus sp. MIT 1011]
MVEVLLLKMQKGIINNQSSGVASCARQIISLAGLAANSQYKLIPRRDF